MAHVLVFQDEPAIAYMIAALCQEEGHLVTRAATVEDTLMILRTSLHPMIVLAERDHSSLHPDGPFFVTIRDHPEFYAQHRYIAIHYWKLAEEENALMNELGVPLVRGAFDIDHLLALVDTAAASLAGEPAKHQYPVLLGGRFPASWASTTICAHPSPRCPPDLYTIRTGYPQGYPQMVGM